MSLHATSPFYPLSICLGFLDKRKKAPSAHSVFLCSLEQLGITVTIFWGLLIGFKSRFTLSFYTSRSYLQVFVIQFLIVELAWKCSENHLYHLVFPRCFVFFQHTTVLPFVLIEMRTTHHQYPSRSCGLAAVCTFAVGYILW